MDKKPKIAVLIPMTSNKQPWVDLPDCSFISIFLPSFIRTYEPKKFNYSFFLGFESNDEFFIKYKDELQLRLKEDDKIFVYPKKFNGAPCAVWTELMKEAYEDGFDYFAQYGDDISLMTINWTSYFVNILKKNNNIGVCGGVDLPFWKERMMQNSQGIIENAFVSRNHYEKLGFFFPPELKSWFSDDHITSIYEGKCFLSPSIQYVNVNRVGGENELSRYKPDMEDKNKYKSIIKRDRKLLFK